MAPYPIFKVMAAHSPVILKDVNICSKHHTPDTQSFISLTKNTQK